MVEQEAPLLLAATQFVAAVLFASPAVRVAFLRRPLKLATVSAFIVFVTVLVFVFVFDMTSPTGPAPLGTTLYVGGLGGFVWATAFFVLAYVPLALLAAVRRLRRPRR